MEKIKKVSKLSQEDLDAIEMSQKMIGESVDQMKNQDELMRQSLLALQKETARIIYKKMEKPEMVDEESLTIIHGSFSDVISNLQSEVDFLKISLQKERSEN